jgi:hypothetical protein
VPKTARSEWFRNSLDTLLEIYSSKNWVCGATVAVNGAVDDCLIFSVAGWELSSIADNHSYTLVDTEEHAE